MAASALAVALASRSGSGFLDEIGHLAEGVRPWLSTGALVALLGICAKLYTDNRKIVVDSEGGIRDHYAKELASLRAQILESQRLADARLADSEKIADARLATAEKRYTEATENADRRHKSCEEECDRLRAKVYGLERTIAQLHKTSVKMFEPRADLPEETKQQMRSMEQLPVSLTGGILRGGREDNEP